MRCKFYDGCDLYDLTSLTCNENGGMYYGDESDGIGMRPAGCFERCERKLEQTKLQQNTRVGR